MIYAETSSGRFRCERCGELVEDLNETIDDETLMHVWVCDDCQHEYSFFDDEGPDCMID